MSDPVRLSRRVADIARCSRSEAERYIEGGWVRVNGVVVDAPHAQVSDEAVEIDPDARLEPALPATIVLHKPAGIAITGPASAAGLLTPAQRWPDDSSGWRVLPRHAQRQLPMLALDADASGLVVFTQDPRLQRRLREEGHLLEQEYVVEVSGTLAPHGLARLCHGLSYEGRALPPCKVSWQNETHLRFAIRDVRPGQLQAMCAQVGLPVASIRRIRIGKIPLARMPAGQWRYIPPTTRF